MDSSSNSEEEPFFLPTHCYLCENPISQTCRSVLQLCSCRVVVCQTCALSHVAEHEEYGVQCLICKKATDEQSGVMRKLDKVKKAVEQYIDRAYESFNLLPRTKDQKGKIAPSKLLSLMAKFEESGFGWATKELRIQFFGAKSSRTKKSFNYLLLQLSRIERLRGGPLDDQEVINAETNSEFLNPGDEEVEDDQEKAEEENRLPYGPLHLLQLSRNIFLEKILIDEEINMACIACTTNVAPKQSVLFSCDCLMVMCKDCALKSITFEKKYKNGVRCPICKCYSVISFDNLEKVTKEEAKLLDDGMKELSGSIGKRLSSKSQNDMKAVIEYLWSNDFTPVTYDMEQYQSFQPLQLKLEVSRLISYWRIKKKTKEGIPLSSEEEEEMKFLQSGFHLPLGPLKHFEVRNNPYLEMYIANTEKEEEEDLSKVDWSNFRFPAKDIATNMQKVNGFSSKTIVSLPNFTTDGELDPRRFDLFKPRLHTPCPKCPANPQSKEYLKLHLINYHEVSDPAQLEDLMNAAVITPVPSFAPVSPKASKPQTSLTVESEAKKKKEIANLEELSKMVNEMNEQKEEAVMPVFTNTEEEGEVVESTAVIDVSAESNTALTDEAQPAALAESLTRYNRMMEECEQFTNYIYEKFSRVTEWKDNYEVILNPRQAREGLSFSDPAIIGTFMLRIRIQLSAQDSAQLSYNPERPDLDTQQETMEGRIFMYSNKSVLSTFPSFLRNMLKFGGVIAKYMNTRGRVLQGNRSFSYYHVPENSEVILRPLVKESDLRIRRPRVFHRKHINRKTPLELAREHVERKRREQERLKYFHRDRANDYNDFSEDRNAPYTDFYLRDNTDDDDEDERDESKAKGLDAMEGGITWHMSRNKDENLKPSALTSERKRAHFNSRPWNNPNSSNASISSLSSVTPSFSQTPVPFVKPEPKNYDSYEKSLLEDVDDDDDDDEEGRDKRPKKKARVKPQRDGGRPNYQNRDRSNPNPSTQFHRSQQNSINYSTNNNNNHNNNNYAGNYYNPRTSYPPNNNNNSQPTPQYHYSHYSDRSQPYSQQKHHHRPRSSSRDRDRDRERR